MDFSTFIKLWNSAHIQLVDIRKRLLSPGGRQAPWLLPTSAYIVFTEGAATVAMDGTPTMVRSFAVMHGGKGVYLDIAQEERLHYYLILYNAALPADDTHMADPEGNPFQAQYTLLPSDPLYVHDKTERMHEQWSTGLELDQLMARSYFIQFIHEIASQLGSGDVELKLPDPVSQSVRYIEEHYREPITLELLGELLQCSPRQLLRKFRSERNVSPIDYLIGLRLRKAKKLLEQTNASLKDIAESVGYADSYYFSRLFKKHLGVSPVHYREQARVNEARPDYPFPAAASSIADSPSSGYIDNGFDNHYQYEGEDDSAMSHTSRKTLTALMICLSLLISACSQGGAVPNTAGETNPAATNTPPAKPPAEAVVQARTIKHAMGETVVKGTPQRVIILTNEGTEALLALGVKPVGAVQSWYQEPWYDHIESKMQNVTVLGDEFQPNLEIIASLKPDLIIGNMARQEKLYPQLNQIAPTVFSEDLLGDWKLNFALYADALHLKAEGEKLMADFDRRVDAAKSTLGDKLKTKISIVRFLPTQVRIYQKDTFSGVLLSQLGFARPASQDKDSFIQVITKEAIQDMDGDVLFYFTTDIPGGEDTSKVVQEWLNDPLFKNLNVYKTGKVVKVGEPVWNSAGGYLAATLLLDELLTYFGAK